MTHFKSLSVIMKQGSGTYSFSSVVLTLCSPNAPPLKPMRITVPKTPTAGRRGQKRKQGAAPREQGRQKKHRSKKVVPEKEEGDPYKELGPIPDLDQLMYDLAGNNHLWINLVDGMLGDDFFDGLPED
ncbi:hypothetical protein TB2_019459 [Malus domestica]